MRPLIEDTRKLFCEPGGMYDDVSIRRDLQDTRRREKSEQEKWSDAMSRQEDEVLQEVIDIDNVFYALMRTAVSLSPNSQNATTVLQHFSQTQNHLVASLP